MVALIPRLSRPAYRPRRRPRAAGSSDVAGADLQHVGVFGDHVDVVAVHNLGDDVIPVSSPTSARIFSPCTPSPWNAYGEGGA